MGQKCRENGGSTCFKKFSTQHNILIINSDVENVEM